jgi:hypothetical protein
MAFELAQIVTQLVETIGAAREVEGGEDGLMDLLGCPAADVHQPDDAGLVDLDAGIAHRARNNRANAIPENEPNYEPDCASDCEVRHHITQRPIARIGFRRRHADDAQVGKALRWAREQPP